MITLTSEVDLVSGRRVERAALGQTAGGTRDLTIGPSGLRFADTTSIRALMLAARTLLGADQMFTVVGQSPDEPKAGASAG